MALIKCPECRKEISDTVDVCPNCGFFLKKKKYDKRIIIGMAVVIIGICGFLFINRVTPIEQTQINKVCHLISEIDSIDFGSKDKIEKAEEQYNELSSKCKWYVKNKDILKEARKSYDSLVANSLDEDISKIGEVVLIKSKEIKRLNDVYDELTEKQQKLVKNKEILNKATEDILAIKISNATSKISDIGTVDLDAKDKIIAAQEAFEYLSDQEKSMVENADTLQRAEETYSELAIKECENLINSIGEMTLDNKEALYKARDFYTSLDQSDKQKVSNADLLKDLNDEYERLLTEERDRKKVMNIGDKVVSNNWEIELKRTNVTAKIVPNSTNGYYMYYYADDEETFVDLVFQIKNINVEILKINGIAGECKVDYKGITSSKNYSLFTSTGNNVNAVYDWDGLDALDTTTLHVAIDMPRECLTNNEPITVRLILAGQEKIIKVR